MPLTFEWDPKKAAANRRKHRVTFEEAVTIFGDPSELMIPDPAHSIHEERFISVGLSDRGRILLVAYTEAASVVRIISAREADKYERRQYRERSHG